MIATKTFPDFDLYQPSFAFCIENHSSDLHYKSNDWFLHEMQHWAKLKLKELNYSFYLMNVEIKVLRPYQM